MPTLTVTLPNGQTTQFSLFKRLSLIGSREDCDIRIPTSFPNFAAYINQTDNRFTLVVPDDKPKALYQGGSVRTLLLQNNTQFMLANITFMFDEQDALSKIQKPKNDSMDAYKRLLNFSEKIASEKDIDALLHTLLLEITEITKAEYSFLLLLENGKIEVKKEHYIHGDRMSSLSLMSDSIVQKVLDKGEAVVVSDALHDQQFSSSLSVINFRLSSVMCAPLLYQGKILGAIYVGNNSFVNVFDKNSLQIMTIYAGQASLLVQNALHINSLKKQTEKLKESLEFTKFGGIIGSCQSMQDVFNQVEKVAKTDLSVLITGETGTGKDLIAREIHHRSGRKDAPFVVVNCGAIPENLLESELFGHVRGAFIGAFSTRAGKFQSAHQGTLFLDEISSVPLHLQGKLLHALQDLKITPMGDNKSMDVNLRVLAATNQDLLAMVKHGLFREDLFYHLNIVHIVAPPLRERGNDVLVMANYFLQKYAQIYGKPIIGLEEDAQNAMLNYPWPGNVRQLENQLRRAIVMCDCARVSVKDLDIGEAPHENILSLSDAVERFRARYIEESLERNAFNKTKTATELRVDPRTIFRHLEQQKKIDTPDTEQ